MVSSENHRPGAEQSERGCCCVGLECVGRKGEDPNVLQCCLVIGSYFFTVALYVKSESLFLFLSPQIIVMYLQVLECERNQTLVQTAW